MYLQQNLSKMQQYHEENNYPKALLYSSGAMILFLLISYLVNFGISLPPQEVGMGGIVVNYGTAEEGMGDDLMSIEEPSVAPEANNTPPDKVVPNTETKPVVSSEASDKTIVTNDAEDAPAVTTTPKTVSAAPSTAPVTKVSKPQVNQNALFKGKKSNGTGGGDGTGSTPGNQGDPDGDPLSNNYGKGGSGFGNTQLSLSGRRFVNLPKINDQGQSSGKIAVEIRVDKTGQVVYARAGVRGTTLSDRSLWTKCEQAVMGASLNQLESAPDVQVGVVVFNFKVN